MSSQYVNINPREKKREKQNKTLISKHVQFRMYTPCSLSGPLVRENANKCLTYLGNKLFPRYVKSGLKMLFLRQTKYCRPQSCILLSAITLDKGPCKKISTVFEMRCLFLTCYLSFHCLCHSLQQVLDNVGGSQSMQQYI